MIETGLEKSMTLIDMAPGDIALRAGETGIMTTTPGIAALVMMTKTGNLAIKSRRIVYQTNELEARIDLKVAGRVTRRQQIWNAIQKYILHQTRHNDPLKPILILLIYKFYSALKLINQSLTNPRRKAMVRKANWKVNDVEFLCVHLRWYLFVVLSSAKG
jgi:hypothetical protein